MHRQTLALICTVLCLAWLVPPPAAAQQAAKQAPKAAQPAFTFKAATEVVLVNLNARDAKGNVVRDLKPGDVTILEDGKPQHIVSFDFENVDAQPGNTPAPVESEPEGTVVAGAKPKPAAKPATPAAPAAPKADEYRDRRLIVLYFDLTTMEPEDVQNVMEQAENFVQKKMQPADLAAVATLGNTLQVNQDFTADKDVLMRTLRNLNPATSSGFEDGTTGSTDGTADDGSTFAADDSEFNIANADRSLESLQSMCDMLAPITQKKSLMYFSSGVQRSGVDNEITLRSAVNSCVKANASIYSVDARGLQANPPGGNATSGSIRGASAFNGGAQSSTLDTQFAQQETISTLANDTGGKAFLDSNDFAPVYAKVQADTSSYYLVGYSSSNHAKDGKYRKIQIKFNRAGLTAINPRPGYYAGRDINHLTTADRQQQLQDELNADVSDHSLDLYLADGYLRLDKNRYYVPVSVTIPGSEIPLHGINPKATPEVDIAGEVIDQTGRKLDHVGQTIRLTPAIAGPGQELQNRNLQYSSGFVLAPGQKYQIRFAARENQTGQMGAFEAVLTIPDVDAEEAKAPHALAMSPVLVGSQLTPARPDSQDPLTATGNALVLNVNHVFSANQHMYLYYEVYDPKLTGGPGSGIKLLTNVAFFRGKVKAFESQLLTTEQVTDPSRHAAVIQIDIPLSRLKPGYYLCQVNAVDDAAGRFAFPRVPVLIRPAAAGTPTTGASPR
ncbi:MAG TPA: VWA domain-containing protein [Terriglobales bacterium]|nr:VWA domain-containing protein [Terriglobales bacterium]